MSTDDIRTPSRRLLLPLLASIVAITPLAVDMYLPAMVQIAADLGATMPQVQISLSVYLGGYALGMLFFGPIADQMGRRRLAPLALGYSRCAHWHWHFAKTSIFFGHYGLRKPLPAPLLPLWCLALFVIYISKIPLKA